MTPCRTVGCVAVPVGMEQHTCEATRTKTIESEEEGEYLTWYHAGATVEICIQFVRARKEPELSRWK